MPREGLQTRALVAGIRWLMSPLNRIGHRVAGGEGLDAVDGALVVGLEGAVGDVADVRRQDGVLDAAQGMIGGQGFLVEGIEGTAALARHRPGTPAGRLWNRFIPARSVRYSGYRRRMIGSAPDIRPG